jgi:hypothetical protein
MRAISFFFAWLWIGRAIAYPQEVPKEYMGFYKNDSKVKVDGKLDKREWKHVKKESDFTFPWLNREPPVTEFYAKVDGQYFNFAYRVIDKDIVLTDFRKESDVAQGDRVEIFFAKSRDLAEYYCLEIDPNANVLDYKASFYRNFDDTWDFQGLLVAAKINKDGYVVEGRIPIEELKSLGMFDTREKGSCFLMGLYRAEYSAAQSDKPQVEWISWIRPDTTEPDFHVPSSFGSFCIASE